MMLIANEIQDFLNCNVQSMILRLLHILPKLNAAFSYEA